MKNTKEVKVLPIKEFVEGGFLQEANRLFFHPLGLSLQVKLKNGEYTLDKIVDARDDPASLIIDGVSSKMIKKAILVNQVRSIAGTTRVETLGFDIQPLRKVNDGND